MAMQPWAYNASNACGRCGYLLNKYCACEIRLLNVVICNFFLTWVCFPLQWRHNEQDGVSNHQRLECLLNRLFRPRSKKTSKLRLCEGNPAQGPVTRKMFPFDDVIIDNPFVIGLKHFFHWKRKSSFWTLNFHRKNYRLSMWHPSSHPVVTKHHSRFFGPPISRRLTPFQNN